MQIVRKVAWILLALAVFGFVAINWGESYPVRIWPGGPQNSILFDWPVGFIALIFMIVGFLPTWLYHRAITWRLERRIRNLENAARAAAISQAGHGSLSPGDTPPQGGETTLRDDAAGIPPVTVQR